LSTGLAGRDAVPMPTRRRDCYAAPMERSEASPDEFIAALPDGTRQDVAALDAEIAAIMSGLERVLWEGAMWGGTAQSIIGYGAQRTVNRSGVAVDWFLVGLASQKAHLSLYVNAVRDGAYLVQGYAGRLGRVKVGSAAVTFKRFADLDLGALRELLTAARSSSAGP
jgi:hypothetical protein